MATATYNASIRFNLGPNSKTASTWRVYTASEAGNEIWRGGFSGTVTALGTNHLYQISSGILKIQIPSQSGVSSEIKTAQENFGVRCLNAALKDMPDTYIQIYDSSGSSVGGDTRVTLMSDKWSVVSD